MRSERGFTLLEIMLVLLLLGISSGLVMLRFPAPGNQLARQGEILSWQLNEAVERAELEGQPYGVAFSQTGWRIIADKPMGERLLSAGMTLRLSQEQQAIPLSEAWPLEPQVWLYPGGETTLFTVTLYQDECQWRLDATGFFLFQTTEVHCNET